MSFWICRNRSSTRAWVERSRALTGSSQTISFGDRARARAIATRWRCPPLNSRGSRLMASEGRPTWSSSSFTRFLAAAASMPCTPSGSARMSPISRAGFSEVYGSWNTTCRSRLRTRRSLRVAWLMSLPSKLIFPPVTGASPRMARPRVVLPEPDSPTRPRVSPRPMVMLMSVRARKGLARNLLLGYSTTSWSTVSSGALSVVLMRLAPSAGWKRAWTWVPCLQASTPEASVCRVPADCGGCHGRVLPPRAGRSA